MWTALSVAVVWLAAIAAYAYEDGMNLFQWMGRFSQVLERPFSIGWMPHTLKFIACALLLSHSTMGNGNISAPVRNTAARNGAAQASSTVNTATASIPITM